MFLGKDDFIDISDSDDDNQNSNTNRNNNAPASNNTGQQKPHDDDGPEEIDIAGQQAAPVTQLSKPAPAAQSNAQFKGPGGAAPANNGAMLLFDEDELDDGPDAKKSSATTFQAQQFSAGNGGAYSGGASQASSTTAQNGAGRVNRVERLVQQQQENLKQKQMMNYEATHYAQQNTALGGANANPYGYHENIDFSTIQKLENEKNRQQYEPGMGTTAAKKLDDLPVLQPANNVFKAQEMQYQFDKDSDDEGTHGGGGAKKQQPDVQQKQAQAPHPQFIPPEELKLDSEDSSGGEEGGKVQQPPVQPTNGAAKAKRAPGARIRRTKDKHEELQGDDNSDEESGDDAQQQQNKGKPKNAATRGKNGADDEENSDEEAEDDGQERIPIARPVEKLEIRDMKEFLTKPVPKGVLLQCTIKRDKSGLGRFYPKYHLYLSNGYQYLMTGKKRSGNKTSNYIISMNKEQLEKNSPFFLGKVRSNFLGTEFFIYDTGENPEECKDLKLVRKELACVMYESNLLGARGPRKMRVLIPDMRKDTGQPYEWQPINVETDSMLSKYKQGNYQGIRFYYNKPPKWNEHVQAFVLNFNGRVDKPSVKNFQMVDEYNDEIIYLQFGRVGEELFNMDLQWPMSPLQAFGICLSSFDYKIACE